MEKAAQTAKSSQTLSKMRPHRTRAVIMAAAREMFHRRPAQTVSVEMIAQHAGLARRTIYNQFGDAGALYRATRDELIFEAARLLPLEVPSDLPPRAALSAYCRMVGTAFADPRFVDLIGSVVRDGGYAPWLVESFERHIRFPILRSLESYLLLLRAKEGRSTLDVPTTARSLLRSLELVAVSSLLSTENGQRPGQVADCTAELIDGFLARAAPLPKTAIG